MRWRSGFPEIVTCTLTWGTIGPIVKHVAAPSSVIVFFRLALGAVVVLAWLAIRRRLREMRPGARPVLLAVWGVVLAVHWLFLFAAFKRLDVAPTILIVFLGPVLMAVGAPVVLGERLRALSVAAIIVAFGGIALITVPQFSTLNVAGIVFALASAVLFAALILMGKLLAPHYRAGPLAAWQLGIAAVAMSPALAGASVEMVRADLGFLVLLGVIHTGATGIFYMRAIRALRAQALSVMFYLEPASAVLYAWWLIGETPQAVTLGGGALVVIAGLAIIFGERAATAPGALPEPVPEGTPG